MVNMLIGRRGLTGAAGWLGAGLLAVMPLAFAGPAAGLPVSGHAGHGRAQLAAVACQAPAAAWPRAGDDWPSFGYDPGFTRDNTGERTLTAVSVHRLRLQWASSSPASTLDTLDQGPAVAGGVLYQQILLQQAPGAPFDRIDIEALNACSGRLMWRYRSPWESIFKLDFGDQTVAGGRVFSPFTMGNGTEELAALTLSGHFAWAYPGADLGALSIVVSGGVLYTTTAKAAFAFDAATGRVLWAIHGDFYRLAVAGGTVYLATATGTRAVTAAAGKLLWTSRNLGGNWYVAVSGGRVFALGLVSMRELNARTGADIWHAKLPVSGAPSNPAIDGHALFFATALGGLFAYRTGNGTLLWSRPALDDAVCTSPAVAGGVVYIGTDFGRVIAFSGSTGTELWQARPAPGQALGAPTIAGGRLYISTCSTGATYAYGLPHPGERQARSRPAHTGPMPHG